MGHNRLPSWFLSATTLVVAIATILAILGLRRSADLSLRVSVDLIQLQAVSTQLDGIEEASSYRKTVDPVDRQRIEELDRQAQAILKQLRIDAANARAVDLIESAYGDYISALRPTLDLLAQEDLEAAEELDENRVDPAFEQLTTLMSQENALALQATRRANQITDLGSIFTIVLATLTIGTIAQRIQQVNHKAQQALADQAVLQARETTLQAERALLEERVAERTRELDAKNEDLTQALEQIQIAQVELVQAEKMATLGQLVAGIAHEINTPLGAIQASSGNSNKALSGLLEGLVQAFGNLPQELRPPFLALLQRCLVPSPSLSSMERRPLRKTLGQRLEQEGLPSPPSYLDRLLDMGIRPDNLEEILPVLHGCDRDWMIALAYNFNRLQHNSNTIRVAVERAGKIVFALKNYAHHDQTPGEPQLVVITESLETVLELFHNLLKRGIEVQRDYQALPPIPCYVDELMQVWTNLIHNAIQAMNGEGVLAIATRLDDQQAIIQITDNGPGIPPELQAKIFEPFFTTKSRGEGSGLGLSICRQVVAKHGGTLMVESNPGCTAFTLSLPIYSACLIPTESQDILEQSPDTSVQANALALAVQA